MVSGSDRTLEAVCLANSLAACIACSFSTMTFLSFTRSWSSVVRVYRNAFMRGQSNPDLWAAFMRGISRWLSWICMPYLPKRRTSTPESTRGQR